MECLVGDDANSVQNQINLLGNKIATFNFLNRYDILNPDEDEVEISRWNSPVEKFILYCYFDSCNISLVKLWSGSRVVHCRGEYSLRSLCEDVANSCDVVGGDFMKNYSEFVISLNNKTSMPNIAVNCSNIELPQFLNKMIKTYDKKMKAFYNLRNKYTAHASSVPGRGCDECGVVYNSAEYLFRELVCLGKILSFCLFGYEMSNINPYVKDVGLFLKCKLLDGIEINYDNVTEFWKKKKADYDLYTGDSRILYILSEV